MAQKKSSHRTAEDKAATAAKRDARRARTERARAQAEERRKAAKRKEQLTRFGLVVGEADAPKSIVIYEDVLCPFCGYLEQTVGDQLDAAVEAGEVKVEYRPLPFLERISDYSPEAANAFAVVLEESGPEVAKAFHDLLFDNQPPESGPFPDEDDFVEWAVEAGADEDAVRPGIEDMTFEGWVEAAGDAASKAGINSTPTVLVDGEKVEGETLQEIAAKMVG